MHLPIMTDFNRERDLRHRIRDMRFFEASFRRNVTLTLADHGLRTKTDQARLRSSFLAWLETFHSTRPYADLDRRDFICFSAGQMLAELVRHNPLSLAKGCDQTAEIWPVGAAYVSYCLGVALSVLEQEFQSTTELSHQVKDARIWQSFLENVGNNPDLAIPFLDLLLGQTPNWTEPALANQRPSMKTKAALALAH